MNVLCRSRPPVCYRYIAGRIEAAARRFLLLPHEGKQGFTHRVLMVLHIHDHILPTGCGRYPLYPYHLVTLLIKNKS